MGLFFVTRPHLHRWVVLVGRDNLNTGHEGKIEWCSWLGRVFFISFKKSFTLGHNNVQVAYLTPINGTIWFLSMLLFVKIEHQYFPIHRSLEKTENWPNYHF